MNDLLKWNLVCTITLVNIWLLQIITGTLGTL